MDTYGYDDGAARSVGAVKQIVDRTCAGQADADCRRMCRSIEKRMRKDVRNDDAVIGMRVKVER